MGNYHELLFDMIPDCTSAQTQSVVEHCRLTPIAEWASEARACAPTTCGDFCYGETGF